MTKTNEKGTKHDSEKLRYDLIPPYALEEVVKVLMFGANKYGEYNWTRGIERSRIYAAIQRHLQAWHKGEDIDEESGLLHLAHTACNLLFLLDINGRDRFNKK